MHNVIFPLKDCTIYDKYPEVNTGLDEIIEITKEVSSSNYFYRGTWEAGKYYKRFDYVNVPYGTSSLYYYAVAENVGELTSSAYWELFNETAAVANSRILLQFDLSQLKAEASASASLVYLNLYTSIARKVPIEYTLNAHPMQSSSAWEMGVGNFTDKMTRGGATWTRKSSIDYWVSEGGDYIGGTICAQEFNFTSTDVRMDVTDIFTRWSTTPNNGIIIKRPDTQESDRIRYGSVSFYSMDTHTVYLPTLEVLYDDHIYDTAGFISSSIYASESISSSIQIINLIDISGSFIYYYSASVLENNVNIIQDGTLLSSSLIYTTKGIIINDVIDTTEYVLSSSVLYYLSASVTESNINVISGSIYISSSIDYNLMSGSYSTLLYTTQNFVSSSVISTPIVINTEISSSLISGSIDIYLKNLMTEYKYNSVVKFNLIIKNATQLKTFYEEVRIGEILYLAENSLKYSILDAYSNRIIIPFSDYTNISLDSTGHFFNASLSGFMPERFYKILFQYTDVNGAIQYFDTKTQFKVIK